MPVVVDVDFLALAADGARSDHPPARYVVTDLLLRDFVVPAGESLGVQLVTDGVAQDLDRFLFLEAELEGIRHWQATAAILSTATPPSTATYLRPLLFDDSLLAAWGGGGLCIAAFHNPLGVPVRVKLTFGRGGAGGGI